MNRFIYSARVLLINVGKMLPFAICLIVLISFTETLFALATSDYSEWGGYVILNKPVSWLIGSYFEYNISHLIVISIISVAIETCIYNKLACLYLGLNLVQKSWFECHEYDNGIYYIVSAINIIICTYLCWKGIVILTKSKRHD